MAESERSSASKNSGERSLPNDKKGHVVERGSTGNEKSTKTLSQESAANRKGKLPARKSGSEDFENKLFSAITNLQGIISKQTEKMADHDKQFREQSQQLQLVANRLNAYEESEPEPYYEGDYYEYELENDQIEKSYTELEGGEISLSCESMKRKAEDENNNTSSRFQSMTKRFKATEACDKDIDPVLAENITELFRNGIDEARYSELIRDENNGRPSNCEGLVVTQTNPMIWEAISQPGRTTDKKMQNIETSVVKSATILAKVVDRMAKMESDIKNDAIFHYFSKNKS